MKTWSSTRSSMAARALHKRWLLALCLSGASTAAHSAVDCAALAAVTTADATVTSATSVSPPATISGVAVTVPICRVQGAARPSLDSEIKFEVWLPATINVFKALTQQFYGSQAKYSCFEGRSNGGRRALMMAQNCPQLFDGIVAGAPSNFDPDLLMGLLQTGKQLQPAAPPAAASLSVATRLAVTSRVLQSCDAADGLVDGQITDPRACNFNIDSMGPAGDGTLTAAETAIFKAMYAGTTSEAGVQRCTGAKLGSETDWISLQSAGLEGPQRR